MTIRQLIEITRPVNTCGRVVIIHGTYMGRFSFLSTVCSVYIIQVTYLINTFLAQEPLNLTTDSLKVKQEGIMSKQ
jgi:hypothetical protein